MVGLFDSGCLLLRVLLGCVLLELAVLMGCCLNLFCGFGVNSGLCANVITLLLGGVLHVVLFGVCCFIWIRF